MVHRRTGRFLRRRFKVSRRLTRPRTVKRSFRISPRLKKPSVAKRILTKPLLPKETLTGTLPISPVGLGAGGASVIGGASGKVGGFVSGIGRTLQKFGQPITFGRGVQRVGTRFLTGFGITSGASAIETAITGEPFNPLSRRSALGAAGFAIGGIPGLAVGTALGLGKVGVRETIGLGVGGAQFVGGAIPDDFNIPFFPPVQAGNTVNIDFGDAPAIQPGAVGGLTGGGGASFQIGSPGGGGDLSALILLLLGIGGVGALVDTRRKKKKKKKKTKKRKKLKRKLRELEEEE